ncbi:MAG TPA: hypothetical protein VGL20_18755 [Candidatus Dormibacteraeota bacterium]|jgi:hypothetical protein
MRIRHLAAIAAAATLSASAFSVVGHASSGGTGAACGVIAGGASNGVNGALGGQNQVGNSLGLLDQLMVPLLGGASGGSSTSGSTGSSLSGSTGSTTGGAAGNSSCGSHLSTAQRQAMGAGTTTSHHRTTTKHHSRG